MRKMMAVGVGVALSALSTAALAEDAKPAAAAASTSDPGMKISAAALVGFGLNNAAPDGASETFNIYGLGFGVRAGVSLPSNLYVGGTFIYHLGKSQESGTGAYSYKTSVGMQYYGVEGGYNIAAGGMTIRPYLGLGQAKPHAEVCIGSVCGSGEYKSEIYIAPGAAFLFDLGSVFAGADVRMVRIMTGEGDKGKGSSLPSVFGTVGMNF